MGDVVNIGRAGHVFHGKLVDHGTQLLAGGITVLMDRCAMDKALVLALTEGLIDAREAGL